MAADERATVAALDTARAVFRTQIESCQGRVIDMAGDSVLAVFDTATGAVSAALAIQQELKTLITGVPEDRRMRFRIGVHLGDVIEKADGTVYGDGVNIAARLEGLADPGGITVSQSVRTTVLGKVSAAFKDQGEQAVKNIAERVHAFSVEAGGSASEIIPSLTDKPSIAVLPFTNMSGDADQEYFAVGMVEEIITALSRIKWLFVISRNSTISYKDKPIDAKTVSRELGVRYLLQGSVRRSGGRVRVNAQLINSETAAHVWADRYDRALDDIFALQDELTMSVISAIEPTLRKAEIARAPRKRPDNLDAYDLYLRALPLATTAMPGDAEKALGLLEKAIQLDPDYAAAHGYIAWCHEQRYLRGGLSAETREAACRHAHAAIAAGSDDATALALGGFVIGVIERDYETALGALDHALALSPSTALAFGFSSIIRAWRGDDDKAIEHGKTGIRLSPYDPLIFLPYVGLAYANFFAGHFNEAASAASRAMAANPRFSVPCYLHAAALVCLGRDDEAKASADLVLALQPGFTISGLVSGNITSAERLERLAEALRRTELPT